MCEFLGVLYFGVCVVVVVVVDVDDGYGVSDCMVGGRKVEWSSIE